MNLSDRQQAILDFIREFSARSKYPPTIREIGRHVGITSTSVVNYNLNILEQKGFIERDREKSRGLKLVGEAAIELLDSPTVNVPLLGRIAAGAPIPVPDTNFKILGEETVEITRGLLPADMKSVYALQVRGNSMVDAMVGDGDIVVMQRRQEAAGIARGESGRRVLHGSLPRPRHARPGRPRARDRREGRLHAAPGRAPLVPAR